MSNSKRDRRIFTDEFKSQIVQLYLHGKSKADIRKEYDLYSSTLDKWIKQLVLCQEKGQLKSRFSSIT